MTPRKTAPPAPILKWAGGKRWLPKATDCLDNLDFCRLIEPFCGSAAIFFHLSPSAAVLADTNSDLIETYSAIASDCDRVLEALRHHAKLHSTAHYYKVRASKPRLPHTRAARFLYLNRTCWNGLYRVNKQGMFNVPKGTKDRVLYDEGQLEQVSLALSRATVVCQDFEKTLCDAGPQDLVFSYPPYTVLHNLNGFVKYNEKIFSWDDQIRLRDALIAAAARGAKIIATNADHQSIWQLYQGSAKITRVPRHSVISGSNSGRRSSTELVIRM